MPDRPDSSVERVVFGKILKPHGVHGEVKALPLSSVAGRFKMVRRVIVEFPDSHVETHEVTGARGAGDTILKLAGIGTREEAERLAGSFLTVPRNEAPPLGEGAWYVFDMIGLAVVDTEGRAIGTVRDIESYPAIDVLQVVGTGGDIMVPMVRDYVLDVNMAGKTITIRVPETILPNRD